MGGKEDVEQMNICILLVEDNPSHMELAGEAIKEASTLTKVMYVKTGEDALSYLYREGKYNDEEKYPRPDLILLDLKLPGTNGKDVLRQIKSDKRTRAIPVIILSISALDKDVDECYMLGANGYITKPMDFGQFVAIVKTIPFYWTFVNTLPKK